MKPGAHASQPRTLSQLADRLAQLQVKLHPGPKNPTGQAVKLKNTKVLCWKLFRMFRLFIMLTLASSKIILEKEAIVTDAIVTSVCIHTHAVVATE